MHYCRSSHQNKCKLCTETRCQMVTAREKSLPLTQCLGLGAATHRAVGSWRKWSSITLAPFQHGLLWASRCEKPLEAVAPIPAK